MRSRLIHKGSYANIVPRDREVALQLIKDNIDENNNITKWESGGDHNISYHICYKERSWHGNSLITHNLNEILEFLGYYVYSVSSPYIFSNSEFTTLYGRLIHYIEFKNVKSDDRFLVYAVNETLNDNLVIVDQL